MLFLISPAKALDYETPPPAAMPSPTEPLFAQRAAELIGVLREKSPQQIAQLMDLSDALSGLNVARYRAWSSQPTPANSKPAALAFDGDVYAGLDAKSLNPAELDWLQQHLCILSGLYGVLRPLDLMQPHRLEMDTRLPTTRGANLYRFWGSEIAQYLNQRAVADKTPIIVNLASEAYFKAVDQQVLTPRVVSCVFEERKGEQHKVVGFFAKRARGLMVRFAVQHRVSTPAQLQAFDAEGYRFAPAASAPDRLVFRRTPPQ